MSMIDPLGDMLSRIRNAQMRNKSKVSTPGSKMRARVLDVLKNEGYIRGYARSSTRTGAPSSRSSSSISTAASDPRDQARIEAGPARLCLGEGLPRINNGLGVAILSTPKGVMADLEARDQNVGGEILCTVF